MKPNVFFVEVPQKNRFEEYVAEFNAQSSLRIELRPALSSRLRCREDAYAVVVPAGFPAVKQVAEKLRGYTCKPILIPFEDGIPSGGQTLLREVKIELSLGNGDKGEEVLPWLYHELDTAVNKRIFNRHLWVYAKEASVVAILLCPEAPDQLSWQTDVEFTVKEAGFDAPITKDVLLVSV